MVMSLPEVEFMVMSPLEVKFMSVILRGLFRDSGKASHKAGSELKIKFAKIREQNAFHPPTLPSLKAQGIAVFLE
jgi:hypothetical protein